MENSAHIRNIAVDLVVTVLTCGLFNLYVQYRQMEALNEMLKEQKYSFWMWLLLAIITFGLYHIYHEYRKTSDLVKLLEHKDSNEAVITVLLALFGLSFVADAIQQSQINQYFGSSTV